MWTAAILLLLVFGAVYVVMGKKRAPPPATRLNMQIDAMEQRAAELEAQLAALDDQESLEELGDGDNAPQDDVGSEGWTRVAGKFFAREIAIPLQIEYLSGSGKATAREITVNGFRYGDDGGVMSAYCHLRGGNRTFYFKRIVRATDPATGAQISELGKWLDAQFLATTPGKAEALLDEHFDAVHSLLYVAKADRSYRAKEKEILAKCLAEVAGEKPDEVIEMAVEATAQWSVPSAIAFGKALTNLSARPTAYRTAVLAAAKAMVDSDKTAVHAEDHAVKRMEKAFRTAV